MNPTRGRQGRGSRSTNRQHSHSRPPQRGGYGSRRRSHSGGSSGYGNRSYKRPHKGRGGGRGKQSFDPSQFINKSPVEAVSDAYTPKHAFDTLGLDARLVNTVTSMGITIPTPIQDKIIPEILSGRDVIGLAETGTGKTAAFLIPLIEKTLKESNRQTLIMTPTRELALQIDTELRKLSRGLRMFSAVCVGGVNINPQMRMLRHRNQFIIGTPGRLLDLLNRKKLIVDNVTTVVLDEADRMLDMGFIGDMRKILSGTPKNRETLFFSATMSDEIKRLVHDFLRDPVIVSVKKKDVADSIEQDVVRHGHHDKFETLIELLKKPEFKRVLIFGSMKHSVEKLSREISKVGIRAESIHGNKSHGQRQRSLGNFKTGQARVLVATDVAARGIHVDNVSHVINYDLPNTQDDYIHRIGRTGRAAQRGKALTFIQGRSS